MRLRHRLAASAGKPAPELLLLRLRRLRAAPLGQPRNPDAPPITPRLLPFPVSRSTPAGARPACWRLLCDACASAGAPYCRIFLSRCTEEKSKKFGYGGGGRHYFLVIFSKDGGTSLSLRFFSDRRRGYKKGSRKSQFALCPSPSNCFLSNHAVNNAKQSQKEQNYFLPEKGLLQKGQREITRKRDFSSFITK